MRPDSQVANGQALNFVLQQRCTFGMGCRARKSNGYTAACMTGCMLLQRTVNPAAVIRGQRCAPQADRGLETTTKRPATISWNRPLTPLQTVVNNKKSAETSEAVSQGDTRAEPAGLWRHWRTVSSNIDPSLTRVNVKDAQTRDMYSYRHADQRHKHKLYSHAT